MKLFGLFWDVDGLDKLSPEFPGCGKTHNLSLLLDLLKDRHPELELLRSTLAILNAYAVEYRYPGESADKEVARQAVKLAEEVRLAASGLFQELH